MTKKDKVAWVKAITAVFLIAVAALVPRMFREKAKNNA